MQTTREETRQVLREGRSKELVGTALEAQKELRGNINSSPLEEIYENALAVMAQVKFEQIDRLETRLEGLIDRQSAAQKQMMSQKPGFFAMFGAREKWHNAQAKTQARMHTLNTRLKTVRDIKEGMGLHSPLVVQMAQQKLKIEKPELVKGWEDMQEAQRQHQAKLRKEEQERKKVVNITKSRGQTLSLTRPNP